MFRYENQALFSVNVSAMPLIADLHD